MTENTITQKNLGSKKKIGEILRFIKAMSALNLQIPDIATKTGLSNRTVENCIYSNYPIGGKLLRELHKNFGISIDWLLSGNGNMMAATEDEIAEEKAIYSSDNPRTDRMINFLKDWSSYASEDDQAWLEMELKFNIKQYKEYLDGQ